LKQDINLHTGLGNLQQQLIDIIVYSQFGLTKIYKINQKINQEASRFDSLITIFPTIGDINHNILKPFSNKAAYKEADEYHLYPLVLELQQSKLKLFDRTYFDQEVRRHTGFKPQNGTRSKARVAL
jgi:hypothetical protein